jgi:hypothetical protein
MHFVVAKASRRMKYAKSLETEIFQILNKLAAAQYKCQTVNAV